MSIKNDTLLFTFESRCEGVAIKVVNNAITVGSDLVDFQTSQRAFEVVDRDYNPIFQMIRRSAGTIQINGIFDTGKVNSAGEQVLLWASEQSGLLWSAKRPAGFSLKPIFKYPAWRYPAEYAQDSATNPAMEERSDVANVINAPGGIPIVGNQGVVSNPTVNNYGPPPLELSASLKTVTFEEQPLSFPKEKCPVRTVITIVPNQRVPPPIEMALEFDHPVTQIGGMVSGASAQMGGGPFRTGTHALTTIQSPGIGPKNPFVVEVCIAQPVALVAPPHLED